MITASDTIGSAILAIDDCRLADAVSWIEEAQLDYSHLPAVADQVIAAKVFIRDLGLISSARQCLELAADILSSPTAAPG